MGIPEQIRAENRIRYTYARVLGVIGAIYQNGYIGNKASAKWHLNNLKSEIEKALEDIEDVQE